jgi:hypothetical protein
VLLCCVWSQWCQECFNPCAGLLSCGVHPASCAALCPTGVIWFPLLLSRLLADCSIGGRQSPGRLARAQLATGLFHCNLRQKRGGGETRYFSPRMRHAFLSLTLAHCSACAHPHRRTHPLHVPSVRGRCECKILVHSMLRVAIFRGAVRMAGRVGTQRCLFWELVGLFVALLACVHFEPISCSCREEGLQAGRGNLHTCVHGAMQHPSHVAACRSSSNADGPPCDGDV